MSDGRCFLPSSSKKVQEHRPPVNARGNNLTIQFPGPSRSRRDEWRGWEAVSSVAIDEVWSALRIRPASEVGLRSKRSPP
jgi:hypothetical protein